MFLVLIDTETGGVDPKTNALLSIGALLVEYKLRKFTVLDSFEGFVKPEPGLTLEATALAKNKITPEIIQSKGRPENEVILDFVRFSAKRRNERQLPMLVGWNIHFDIGFLQEAFKRQNLGWPFYFITFDVAFYWKHWNIVEHGQHAFGGIDVAARTLLNEPVLHSALADVKLVLRIWSHFLDDSIDDSLPKIVS